VYFCHAALSDRWSERISFWRQESDRRSERITNSPCIEVQHQTENRFQYHSTFTTLKFFTNDLEAKNVVLVFNTSVLVLTLPPCSFTLGIKKLAKESDNLFTFYLVSQKNPTSLVPLICSYSAVRSYQPQIATEQVVSFIPMKIANTAAPSRTCEGHRLAYQTVKVSWWNSLQ